ncbi:hypothetical protein [Paenibacillus rigui]|uniref:Uncharacterized protein n=1 Tax=Paenibacillus rigui TaxID=554312 RepID=A0A229UHG3_9BACL|nr:hypothetical protein [Paenibacillus rigui]OXM82847.1 hypothetical protein CF651_28835 [Paenibacillus rigui]
MLRNNKEKRDLERAAAQIFIDIYNNNHDPKLRLLYQRERPDAVVQVQDATLRPIGIEITHLFYDSEEAKMLLGRSKASSHSMELIELLVKELNNRIQVKEAKISTYSSEYPIALLIRNASPAFGMSEILREKHLIYKPQGKFTHVWFLSRDGSSEWLLKDLNGL